MHKATQIELSRREAMMPYPTPHPCIAVIIPCYNEAATVTKVINDFKIQLPHAHIYVYDNASTDNTAELAKQAGAIVKIEPKRGKGNVVRSAFDQIEADIYLLVDGDDTYDSQSATDLIKKLNAFNLAMVVGVRVPESKKAFRLGHKWGNRFFTGLIGCIFGRKFNDVFSGYRVFSKKFVKSFPAQCCEFDIEIEMTIYALQYNWPVGEVYTRLRERPAYSSSKLNTFKDGFKILWRIFVLTQKYYTQTIHKPMEGN